MWQSFDLVDIKGKHPDPAFHYKSDPSSAFHLNEDPDPDPHPWLNFEPLKLLNFDFNADPDPAFHSNADPDPASKK